MAQKTDAPDRPNWVEARAKCTIVGTFNKIADAIREDVSCFNRLPNSERGGRKYQCDTLASYCLAVTNDGDRGEVRIRLDGDSVEVLTNRVVQFSVRQKWNEETLTCDLYIDDDEATCLWKISQRAIGDFMFPEG